MAIASLSLDLDNKWSYLKTHGDAGWDAFPSYFDQAVPRILDFLNARGLTITFFVVGQDAALDKNRVALQAIAAAGHEIGNHSYRHEPWLHLYSETELDAEIARAEEAIVQATGQHPVGFRGPGFSLSSTTLRVLARRAYLYDATVFPNLLNPLARAYFFATSNLSREEREQRKALFGSWRDALRQVKAHGWQIDEQRLIEIPVTTMPLFKIPIHFSYVLYLSAYSKALARLYFRFALAMCKATGTEPSLLLHPLDFLGNEDDRDLAFFPGMQLRREAKLALLSATLADLQRGYEVVTMRTHAQKVAQSQYKQLKPRFDQPN